MSSNFYRGVSSDSDFRFKDRGRETSKSIALNAPAEYAVKISMAKVYRPVIEGWISQRVTELLGFEDDVVVGLITTTLQAEVSAACTSVQLLQLAHVD